MAYSTKTDNPRDKETVVPEKRKSRTLVLAQVAIWAAIIVVAAAWIVHNRFETTVGERVNRVARAKNNADFLNSLQLSHAIVQGDAATFKRLLGQQLPTDPDVAHSFSLAASKGRTEIV